MQWPRFLLGFTLTVGLMVALAEGFLRLFPPSDVQPFLGEESGLKGVYQADADFGVAYRSFDDFARHNRQALKPFLPLDRPRDSRPTWALFGNSFVHAPGMLADTLRKNVPERQVFNLQRNEPFWVRFAQVRLLLDHGFRPERIIFAVMMVDMPLQHTLEDLQVTSTGAMTFRPEMPEGLAGGLVQNSRLAMTAWFRSGLHPNPGAAERKQLHSTVPPELLTDLDRLFGGLARETGEHGVPVTVLLIPSFEQICRGEQFVFQDALGAMLRRHGFEVCDVRDAFLTQTDKPALFIPDKHFSPHGNDILLGALLDHLDSTGGYHREASR